MNSVQRTIASSSRYVYNPDCRCAWCANGGRPAGGYFTVGYKGGLVYQSNDSYDEPHQPPPKGT